MGAVLPARVGMNVRDLEIPVPIFLAPMAGITDPPFRAICREHGAPVTCTEMVSAAGLCQHGRRTLAYLDMAMDPGPTIIQIFGKDAVQMAEAASICAGTRRFIAVDINMGCPVRKVVRNGAGAALLAKPDLAAEIVRSVKDAVALPVFVKIRSGITSSSIVAPGIAARLADSGADAITVHARTAAQGYSGTADWRVISAVKAAVKVPVIGNGDVRSASDARRMMDETGCDGIMVGRAAVGNPWLFGELRTWWDGKTVPAVSIPPADRLAIAMRHMDHMVAFKGSEEQAMKVMRKHFIYYTRGVPNSVSIRPAIVRATTRREIETLVNRLSA
ncbi:MAG: tRNA dihydrouridine synthase DusB [Deltaproteobacteria bacterium]|nr:tRNA dihydrouridine synthase DusB [Deltaproteobacteria bacterium]